MLGWVNMLLSPQLWAVAVTDMELELPDLFQSSRTGSQQRSVWQWQHSIQLCNTPTLLMHFTLSRLNCFGLLISFSSSKQNFFPPFSLTKSFAICSKSIGTFLMLCYCPHLGLHSKKNNQLNKKTTKNKKTKKGSLSISVSALTKLKLKHSVH